MRREFVVGPEVGNVLVSEIERAAYGPRSAQADDFGVLAGSAGHVTIVGRRADPPLAYR